MLTVLVCVVVFAVGFLAGRMFEALRSEREWGG